MELSKPTRKDSEIAFALGKLDARVTAIETNHNKLASAESVASLEKAVVKLEQAVDKLNELANKSLGVSKTAQFIVNAVVAIVAAGGTVLVTGR